VRDGLVQLPRLERRVCVVRRGDILAGHTVGEPKDGALPPQMPQRVVPNGAVEPPSHRRGDLPLRAVAPQCEEDVLHDLLSHVRRARLRVREAPERVVVLGVQRLQCRFVARAHAGDERRVAVGDAG